MTVLSSVFGFYTVLINPIKKLESIAKFSINFELSLKIFFSTKFLSRDILEMRMDTYVIYSIFYSTCFHVISHKIRDSCGPLSDLLHQTFPGSVYGLVNVL